MNVEDARAQYEKALRGFASPIRNNATAGSLGTRNTDEQNFAEAGRALASAGLMYPLRSRARNDWRRQR